MNNIIELLHRLLNIKLVFFLYSVTMGQVISNLLISKISRKIFTAEKLKLDDKHQRVKPQESIKDTTSNVLLLNSHQTEVKA